MAYSWDAPTSTQVERGRVWVGRLSAGRSKGMWHLTPASPAGPYLGASLFPGPGAWFLLPTHMNGSCAAQANSNSLALTLTSYAMGAQCGPLTCFTGEPPEASWALTAEAINAVGTGPAVLTWVGSTLVHI